MQLLLVGIVVLWSISSSILILATEILEEKSTSQMFVELFGETLYKWKNEEEAIELPTVELLKDKKVIGVYFSASWCGPCQQFTPILAEFYKKMNSKGKKFEVIFVSRDRSAEEFGRYYSKMPWLAIPLTSLNQVLERLAPKYKVPCLCLKCGSYPDYNLVERDTAFSDTGW